MGYDNFPLRRIGARSENKLSILILHLQAVNELIQFYRYGNLYPRTLEDFRQVAFPEGQFALDFVIMFVEGSACYNNPNRIAAHGQSMLGKSPFVKGIPWIKKERKFKIFLFRYNIYNYYMLRRPLDHIVTFFTIKGSVSLNILRYYFRKEWILKEVFYRPLRAKGAVFLCAIIGLILVSCAPSPSVNLNLDSEILSLATNTKKIPVSIDEKIPNDTIANYYINADTRQHVIDFFTSLTKSSKIAKAILDNAVEHEVPAGLAFAIAYEESRFNPNALNRNPSSIDRGLFQLNSLTFPEMTDMQAYDPIFNAKEGVKYFKHVLEISGNEVSALAMYNAGRTRVSNTGAPVTTLGYISRVLNYEKNIDSLFTAKVVAQSAMLGRIRIGLLTEPLPQVR